MKPFSKFDRRDLKFPLLVFNAEGAKVFAEVRRGMTLAIPSAVRSAKFVVSREEFGARLCAKNLRVLRVELACCCSERP